MSDDERAAVERIRATQNSHCGHHRPTDIRILLATITSLMAERDAQSGRLRQLCAALVNAVGADGPCNAEDATVRLVERHEALLAERDALREAVGSIASEMHDTATNGALDGMALGVRFDAVAEWASRLDTARGGAR